MLLTVAHHSFLRLLSLPQETKDEIFGYVADIKVNFIFESRGLMDKHGSDNSNEECDTDNNSLDEECRAVFGIEEPDSDDSDFEFGDDEDSGSACPLRYEITPLPCNSLVCKQYLSELEKVYERGRQQVTKILEEGLRGSSRWSKRFKEDQSDEFLQLCEMGRFIFDTWTEDTFKMFEFIPTEIIERVRFLFLTRFNFGCDDGPTREAWSKEPHNPGYTPFVQTIDETFNLHTLAICTTGDEMYGTWAPVDCFSLLDEGKIAKLELVYREVEKISPNGFEAWHTLYQFFESPESSEDGEDDDGTDQENDVEDWPGRIKEGNEAMKKEEEEEEEWKKRMKRLNERVQRLEDKEKKREEEIKAKYIAHRLTFEERFNRGVYRAPWYIDQWDLKQEEGTIYRIQPKIAHKDTST